MRRLLLYKPQFFYIYLKYLHWLKVNECVEYNLLSLTYRVLATTYLAIFITFSLLPVPAPQLMSPFLARQPSPPCISQIARS